jgi:phospholipase C
VGGVFVLAWASSTVAFSPRPLAKTDPISPIQHVVIIDMENHSFDNVLGRLCVQDQRCDGATVGQIADGSTIALPRATDIVPPVAHDHDTQTKAIADGAMNGFSLLKGCTAKGGYKCYQQFAPKQIPNLAALARAFVVSDRTFENDLASSWGSHLEMVSASLDGFYGSNPVGPTVGASAGCLNSGVDALWQSSPEADPILVPACVPFPDGTGAYRPTPVSWVPTIMDRLDEAQLSWTLYVGDGSTSGTYGWPVCPTFADCVETAQTTHVHPARQIIADAQEGTLPAFSLVTPTVPNSQHNKRSMLQGDNWLRSVISALEQGPEWISTAIFITYDDCGCFYDHVPPPPGLGIREPMVIVSPWARAGFTDSNVASFFSMLAFTESTFGLQPLSAEDAVAYPYTHSFDFLQHPLAPVPMRHHRIPAWERRWLRTLPTQADDET